MCLVKTFHTYEIYHSNKSFISTKWEIQLVFSITGMNLKDLMSYVMALKYQIPTAYTRKVILVPLYLHGYKNKSFKNSN